MTLADGIEEIYKQYGYFAEKTISVTLSGVDGAAEIKKIMDKFRGNAPNNLTTQTLLRQKTSWNKQLLLLTALKN